MQALKAIRCFTGAWTIINTTLTNETTGEIIPQWHGNYPNGITIYTKWKQTSFLITANDRTHPELRPGELELPAGPTDSDARWALIGKNTLAAGGSYLLSRHLEPEDSEDEDKFLPSGTIMFHYHTATLPSWLGRELTSQFEFHDECNTHALVTKADGLRHTVYYGRI